MTAFTPRCREAPTRIHSRSKPPSSCSRRSAPRARQAPAQSPPSPRAQDRIRGKGGTGGCRTRPRQANYQPRSGQGAGPQRRNEAHDHGASLAETAPASRKRRSGRRNPAGRRVAGAASCGTRARSCPVRSSREPACPRRAAFVSRARRVPARQSGGARRPRDRPRLRPRAGGSAGAARHAARDRALGRGGARRRTGKFAAGAPLPEIAPIERAGSDADGFPLARPVAWSGEGEAPQLAPDRDGRRRAGASASAPLARLIARAKPARSRPRSSGRRSTRSAANRVVGVFRRTRDGGVIVAGGPPRPHRVPGRSRRDAAGAADGELVVAEELPSRRFGKRGPHSRTAGSGRRARTRSAG